MARYDHRWRAVRLAVLARDRHQCQMRLPGCTGHADTVDHIVALFEGGARLDPTNLRAACKHCNSVDGATRGNNARTPTTAFRW